MSTAAGQIVLDVDFDAVERASSQRPIVQLVQTVTQNAANNTNTAITFTQEVFDSHGFHNTASNTSRVTPTVAGIYRVSGVVYHAGLSTQSNRACWIRKNGTADLAPATRDAGATSANVSLDVNDVLIDMNGTTDYVELVFLQVNTGSTALATATAGNQYACSLTMSYERDLI